MDARLATWAIGSILLPILPVAATLAALRFARRPLTVVSVLGDGVLFFYAASTSAVLMMDFWNDRLLSHPRAGAQLATMVFLAALLLLFFALGAYFFVALARASERDADGEGFELARVAHLSWMTAATTAILAFAARAATGVY